MKSLVLTALVVAGAPASETPGEASGRSAGVVRVARGEVRVVGARGDRAARSGALVGFGEALAVESGWVELLVGPHVRVRLSAGTGFTLEAPGRVRLARGRAWLALGRHGSAWLVEAPAGAVELRPGASAAIEASGAGRVVVLEGTARLAGGGSVGPGRTAGLAGDDRSRVGGAQTRALLRAEARAGLGDLEGWRAFLLRRSREVEVAPASVPRPHDLVRSRAVSGTDGAARLLLEEALRPPPFFAEDLPGAGGPEP